jgi:lipoprotein-anchoring transpeptidase ErfK/SrfK
MLTAMPPSHRDVWSGLRHAPDMRYAALIPEPMSEIDPRFFPRVLDYPTLEKPGSIIIDTQGRYLYYVEGRGKAIRYGVGVGRPGFAWRGTKQVSAKREWPEWRPPADMLLRRPDLPVHMAGGPSNPLGARAIYLGSSIYRIHGSNEPDTIGHAVSSGCFRMRNADVIDLYDRVKIGTRVVVM